MASSYGLAITLEKANTVGFTPDNNWQQVEYTFGPAKLQRYLSPPPSVASGAARTVMY